MSVLAKHTFLILSEPEEGYSYDQPEIPFIHIDEEVDHHSTEIVWPFRDYNQDQFNTSSTYSSLPSGNGHFENTHCWFEPTHEFNESSVSSSSEIQSYDESSMDTDIGNSDAEFVREHV